MPHVPAKDPSVNRALKAVFARKEKCWIKTENASPLLSATVFTTERSIRLWKVTTNPVVTVFVLAGKCSATTFAENRNQASRRINENQDCRHYNERRCI